MRKNLELLEAAVPVLIPDPPAPVAHKSAKNDTSSSTGTDLQLVEQEEDIFDTSSESPAMVSSSAGATIARGSAKELEAAAAWWDTAADAELAVALTRETLGLDTSNSSVSINASTADNSSDSVEHEDEDSYYTVRSRWVAHCTSAVNHTTLKPSNTAFCTVVERGNASNIGGNFTIQQGADGIHDGKSATSGLFGKGPMARSWRNWLIRLHIITPERSGGSNRGLAVSLAAAVWDLLVPTGSVRVLAPLLRQLAILELEYEWEVLMVYVISETDGQ